MTLLLLVGIILLSRKLSQIVTSQEVQVEELLIVIDAGHGGEDPGKVGINGALEKDINLQMAEKLRSKLEESGVKVRMTREDDVVPDKKNDDMRERLLLIEELEPVLVVSVHQNSFSDESVHGAQVFYYTKSDKGREAAQMIQSSLLELDSTNNREIKANSEYYLLKKTSVPTVIVECGFLSNLEEANLLILDEYQEEITESICTGILKWLDK